VRDPVRRALEIAVRLLCGDLETERSIAAGLD
jgi:hypothetical protein